MADERSFLDRLRGSPPKRTRDIELPNPSGVKDPRLDTRMGRMKAGYKAMKTLGSRREARGKR